MTRIIFSCILFASIIPLVSHQEPTFTHYVTPDGSSSSNCSQAAPCSITRAVALIGTTIGPGSTVHIQEGIYSQAILVASGNATENARIKFIGQGNVRLVGTRDKPTQWTLVPGRQYTYVANVAYGVGQVAQRPPVSTWQPILVDDRTNPAYSLGRPFWLDFPVYFKRQDSLDYVERQHCSFRYESNRVYVHMCHDGPPSDEDNLYVAPGGWGALRVEGDYLQFENLTIEHSNSGLMVLPSSMGGIYRNIHAKASFLWFNGVNTLAEDVSATQRIQQGRPDYSQCYDANPNFGVGECWNASGEGHALLVGQENRTTSYGQIIRRAEITKSWNAGNVSHRNTVEDSHFWGFPNHILTISGTGVTIKGNVFHAAQDALYAAREDLEDITVTENIFYHTPMFWTSNGSSGGNVPKKLIFTHNIVPVVLYDFNTIQHATSQCNVFIAKASYQFKVTWAGGTSSQWTLAEAQSKGYEIGSKLYPQNSWKDGTVFLPGNPAFQFFDFTPVQSNTFDVCPQKAGPSRFRAVTESEEELKLEEKKSPLEYGEDKKPIK